jgi:hypothetical protein
MQVPKSFRRDAWCPERHCGANRGVEHPLRKCCSDACFDLNVDDRSASALLAVVSADTLAVERMPRVVNYNFPPDVGRMTA